ncbi:MAG: type II secretion system protein [Planctomycetaceae bacterium]
MSRRLNFQYGVRKTSGFTLLELLLVVFIMSVLAFSAVSLTDTMESSQDQYRYERARNQAADLKKAIIDRVDGQEVVSGFVADMGNFPIDMAALAFGISDSEQKDKAYMQSTKVKPYYDPTTSFDSSVGLVETFRNSTANSLHLDLLGLETIKGFRGSFVVNEEEDPNDLLADEFFYGSYLELQPGSNTYTGEEKPRFDNGWGNLNGGFSTSRAQPGANLLTDDDKTHGWKWEFSTVSTENLSEQFLLYSLGKNGIADPSNSGIELYSRDLLLTSIDYAAWSVEAASIEVEVVNDVADLDGYQFAAALLILDSTQTELPIQERWRTIPSTSVIAPINLGQTYSLAFNLARIPAGTHILLLTGSNREYSTPIGFAEEISPGSSGQPEKQRVVVSDHLVYQLELTLPNKDDDLETKTSDSGLSLRAALEDLNLKFEEDVDFEIKPISYQYNSPFSYDIEIDIEDLTGKQNSDFDEITVLLPNTLPAVRGKRVHINPKQGNKLLINLSTIVAQ